MRGVWKVWWGGWGGVRVCEFWGGGLEEGIRGEKGGEKSLKM